MQLGTDNNLLIECLDYFQGSPGFLRIMERIRDKYRSLGYLGGNIVLSNLSAEEKQVLSGFLKKDLSTQKSLTLRIEVFQKRLAETRFCGVLLEDILEVYFGEELFSKREIRDKYQTERNNFFRDLSDAYSHTPGGQWLEYAWFNKQNAYKVLSQRYDTQRAQLKHDLNVVCQALNNLPVSDAEMIRLPVLAAAISKNPHAFDGDTPCGQLLQYALMYRFESGKPGNAEERAELYYKAGVLIDEVSNYVLSSGLRGYTSEGLHQGWEGFNQTGEPLVITLTNLSSLQKVISPQGKVYVLENPGVFAALRDKVQDKRLPLICTYGQIKIAALVLLDMLAREGTSIYYSGDFDPEGLLIADRLSTRFGDKLKLWRYTPEDYHAAMSAQVITGSRLKQLDKLKNEELLMVAEQIKQNCLAGYQELLLEKLLADVEKINEGGFQ